MRAMPNDRDEVEWLTLETMSALSGIDLSNAENREIIDECVYLSVTFSVEAANAHLMQWADKLRAKTEGEAQVAQILAIIEAQSRAMVRNLPRLLAAHRRQFD